MTMRECSSCRRTINVGWSVLGRSHSANILCPACSGRMELDRLTAYRTPVRPY